MRISKFFIPVVLIVLTVACGRRPSYVLSEDKLVDLIVDMELTEAYVTSEMGASSQERIAMGRQVLEYHGVSEETLDTTLAWYGRNMDEYSKLFEKVDKEIESRREHYTKIEGVVEKEGDDLWIYNPHQIISPLSGDEFLTFSIPVAEIEKGNKILLSFYLANPVTVKTTLGALYKEGGGEAINSSFNSKNKIEVEFYSDSAKNISNVFGIVNFKDKKNSQLYIDSISLKSEPMDTLNYRHNRRNLKKFGA